MQQSRITAFLSASLPENRTPAGLVEATTEHLLVVLRGCGERLELERVLRTRTIVTTHLKYQSM
jgi:hypothetical protein